jgi:hypothetical protein
MRNVRTPEGFAPWTPSPRRLEELVVVAWRMEAKIISRGDGRSIVAAAAYRARAKLQNERDGSVCDYRRRRGDHVRSEILLPPGAPPDFANRATLWNAVEAAERRKDARLGREFQLGIPRELPPAVRDRLVRDWVRAELVERFGVPADVAWHTPRASDGGGQPHAHVLVPDRALTDGGLGKGKIREWNAVDQLEAWRASWAAACNKALEAEGRPERVSHLANADRGLDSPIPKVGTAASAMERRGVRSRRGEEAREVAALNSAIREARRNLAFEREGVEALERSTEAARTRQAPSPGGGAERPTRRDPEPPQARPAPAGEGRGEPDGWAWWGTLTAGSAPPEARAEALRIGIEDHGGEAIGRALAEALFRLPESHQGEAPGRLQAALERIIGVAGELRDSVVQLARGFASTVREHLTRRAPEAAERPLDEPEEEPAAPRI